MLYVFARILMRTALRFFYRRVYVTGLETIPIQGPAILVCNHPSSLMDAALLGVLVKRKLYFFARGDVFANGIASRVLRALHMLPVHNHEAGRSTIDHNTHAFSEARKILADGGIIVFFPEGTSHVERKLYPLRKGIFRLASQTAGQFEFGFEIPIIPVGINYTSPKASREDVMVHISTPLMLSEYRLQYEQNNNASILKISKDCYASLFSNVLHVDETNRQSLAEMQLELKRNDYTFYTKQWAQATRNKFEEEKKLCRLVNEMAPEEAEMTAASTKEYFSRLKSSGVDDKGFSETLENFSFVKKMFIWLGWPVFIAGYLLNALPVLIAKRIADTKVYRLDFYSWIFVAGSAVLAFVWYLLLFLGFLLVDWKYAVSVVLIAGITGIIAHQHLLRRYEFRRHQAVKRLQHNQPAAFNQLTLLRNTVKV